MPHFILVLVRPEFITKNVAVLSILKHCGVFDIFTSQTGRSVEALIQEWEDAPYMPLHVKKYDPVNHFGPTITINGQSGEPVDITLPWSAIVGVVDDHSGKMPIGF